MYFQINWLCGWKARRTAPSEGMHISIKTPLMSAVFIGKAKVIQTLRNSGLVDGEYPVWYWDHECPAAYQIADGFRDWLERVVAGPA